MRRLGLLVVAFGLVSFVGCPSHAAFLRSEPVGSQLDADPIHDLLVPPGDLVQLSIFFENSTDYLGPIPRPTRFIDYRVEFDPTELRYQGSSLDVSTVIADWCLLSRPCGSSLVVGDGWLDISHRTAFANLLFPAPELLLDVLLFAATGVGFAPGDGLADYSLSGSNRGVLGLTISSFGSNGLDVQAVPSPLPILGLASAFRIARRLRRRLGRNPGSPLAR